MIKAAGIMIMAKSTGRILFLLRGNGGDHPNEWAFPGGKEEDEDGGSLKATAVRETLEESGFDASAELLVEHTRNIATAAEAPALEVVPAGGTASLPDAQVPPAAAPGYDVDFTTYMCKVDSEFLPMLCEEHIAYCWAPPTSPPVPLHPGAEIAVQRLKWDELDVARAISEGKLTSPQVYQNITFFAMRVTGTGMSYRTGLKEHVWRDPSIYMTDRFCERCAGLPVILNHPKEVSMLDTKEYTERVIGAIMFAYLEPEVEEVWAIVRTMDKDVAKMITDDGMSTSPAVVFCDPSVNMKLELENGEPFLIEGEPTLLDHLAVCQAGVWDKGGPPSGILIAADSIEPRKKIKLDSRRLDVLLSKASMINIQLSNLNRR